MPRQQQGDESPCPAYLLSDSCFPSSCLSPHGDLCSAQISSSPSSLKMCHLLLYCSSDGGRQNPPPDVLGPALCGLYPPHPEPQPLTLTAQTTSHVILLPVPQTGCAPACHSAFAYAALSAWNSLPLTWLISLKLWVIENAHSPVASQSQALLLPAVCPQRTFPSRVCLWNSVCLSPRP